MRAALSSTIAEPSAATRGCLCPLIDLIGDNQFERALMDAVHRRFCVDYLHIFRLENGCPQVIASVGHDGSSAAQEQAAVYRQRQIWRADAAMYEASRAPEGQPWLFHLDTQSLSTGALRSYRLQMKLQSRTMIIGRGLAGVFGMSLVWSIGSSGPTPEASFFELIFAILGRHLAISENRRRISDTLASVECIEARLREILGAARPREIEVGARLLFGQSANDAAVVLNVSKETVISHRKRLYERLGVQTGRDLLLWYLASQ